MNRFPDPTILDHPIGAIEPVKDPSWLTIAIAAVATGIILWALWSGALFGG